MEEEKIVTEVTENVEEQPTEEVVEGIELTDTTDPGDVTEEEKEEVRTYTDEDLDRIIARKLSKQEAKLRKEFAGEISKYKTAETVLNTGLGTNDIDEATEKLKEFYKEQGVNIPDIVKPVLTEKEEQILAKAEAEEIIEDGYDEMTKEANRLASKGYQNLNSKEKVIFNTLAERLTTENKKSELLKNGIKADILEDNDFKTFVKKFDPRTSIVEIHDLYKNISKTQEKPKIGSMVSTESNKIKDFYSQEEFDKLTEKDLDDPKVMEIVRKSMLKW